MASILKEKDIEFVYKSISSSFHELIIKSDPDGITNGLHEPSWNFRLWEGSIVLAQYLESIKDGLESATLIEMGAGTGLPCLVAARLGAGTCVATDLPHAQPLLRHNLSRNLIDKHEKFDSVRASTETSSFQCLSGHILTAEEIDSDEYMCSICDVEIDVGVAVKRCIECNFDMCSDCSEKVMSAQVSSFPTWFQVHLESSRKGLSENDICKFVVPAKSDRIANVEVSDSLKAETKVFSCSLDWESERDVEKIFDLLTREVPHGRSVLTLIAADVTYNRHAIDSLFIVLQRMTARGLAWGDSENSGGSMKLILTHHVRSFETTAHLWSRLEASGWAHDKMLADMSGIGTSNTDGREDDTRDMLQEGDATVSQVYIVTVKLT